MLLKSPNSRARDRATELLRAHGVAKPSQIDVVAMAEREGIAVRVCSLQDADGYLIRWGNVGDILVNGSIETPRTRFTIAHELGHWLLHPDTMIQTFDNARVDGPAEGAANAFAAELLMPEFMMPKNVHLVPSSLWQAKCIATDFRVSLSAAALRYAEIARLPVVAVLSNQTWTVTASCSSMLTSLRVPRGQAIPELSRLALLHGRSFRDMVPMDLPTDVWFDQGQGVLEEHSMWQGKIGVTILNLPTE